LAEKSVVLEHARALAADNLQVQTISKMSEHFASGSIEQQGLLWIFTQLELLLVAETAD